MRDGNITVFVMSKRLESRVTVSEDITELLSFHILQHLEKCYGMTFLRALVFYSI